MRIVCQAVPMRITRINIRIASVMNDLMQTSNDTHEATKQVFSCEMSGCQSVISICLPEYRHLNLAQSLHDLRRKGERAAEDDDQVGPSTCGEKVHDAN
jgi:hypothetical protein